jgi:cobalt-zinc-cadmium efflux system membrane fusion protein
MDSVRAIVAAALVGFVSVGWSPSIAAAQGGAPIPSAEQAVCKHGIEGAKCPFCTPGLIESDGFCGGHGVAEALCVECRPYLKTAFVAAGDWCAEHETPESQCVRCNPALAGEGVQAGQEPRYRRQPSITCSTASTEVRLASASIARTAGFEYGEVRTAPLTREVVRNAEIAYDANRYARLSSRAPGVVVEVLKDLGQSVEAGEAIAIVDSTELGSAKADLLQARELLGLWEANSAREQSLLEKGAGTQREAIEAQTRLAEARIAVSRARQRLQNLGLAPDQLERVEQNGDTSSLLAITAPFAGMVVERSAVMGEVVSPTSVLFGIADTGMMWAMIDLTEADPAVVRPGQEVLVTMEGLSGRPFAGRLTWVSTQLDPKTRTIKARAELDNGGGQLRANMFGRATIRAGSNRQAVLVPKEAVQWEGCCNVAFLRADDEGTHFRPVRLTLGFDAGDRYEVLEGLAGGETIVTRGSFILKNEILKDAVGAGCCEVDHLAK